MGARTATRTKGAATRARIVAEARRVLIEEGYDALVLRRVAAAVGIQLGNLQYYFPSRDSLVVEILQAESRSDLATLRALVERGGDPHERLRAIVLAFVRKWRGEAGLVHATMTFLSKHNPALRRAYRDYYAAFYADLGRVLEAVDPGRAPRVYATRARVLNALMDGAAMQMQVGPLRRYLDAVGEAARAIAQAPRAD